MERKITPLMADKQTNNLPIILGFVQSILLLIILVMVATLPRNATESQPRSADASTSSTVVVDDPATGVVRHPAAVGMASELIQKFEGLRLDPYHDQAGYPTICYGHLLSTKRHARLHHWKSKTTGECLELLEADLAKTHQAINQMVVVPLNPYQEAALMSFTYNVGNHALARSTLLQKLNADSLHAVPQQMMKWVHAGERTIEGLVKRREQEIQVWLGHFLHRQ